VTRGPLACDSSLCTSLCLATISLVISLVLYISFVTDFYGGLGGGVAATEPDLRGFVFWFVHTRMRPY